MSNILSQEELLGKLIPNVYIDGITLESSGDPPPQDNPHIDADANFAIVEDKFKPRSGTSAKSLNVIVDLSIKEILDDDLVGRWFDEDKVVKYIKLMVVQSKDVHLTQALSDNRKAIGMGNSSKNWNMDALSLIHI